MGNRSSLGMQLEVILDTVFGDTAPKFWEDDIGVHAVMCEDFRRCLDRNNYDGDECYGCSTRFEYRDSVYIRVFTEDGSIKYVAFMCESCMRKEAVKEAL